MQTTVKEWTTTDLGDFSSIASQDNVSWIVRTIKENNKTFNVVLLSKPGYNRLRLKSHKLTLKQLLDIAVNRIQTSFRQKVPTAMLTLDQLKEKIKRIDEIHTILEELDKYPDPVSKYLSTISFHGGGLDSDSLLSNLLVKKAISVCIERYHRELFNELTTLMGEIRCSNNTASVESQSSSNQTTTEDSGK